MTFLSSKLESTKWNYSHLVVVFTANLHECKPNQIINEHKYIRICTRCDRELWLRISSRLTW